MLLLKSIRKLVKRLSESTFDTVGQYNPQLLREWQGRLRWRNLLLTVSISLLVQFLVLARHLSELPSISNSKQFCFKETVAYAACKTGNNGLVLLTDWVHLWAVVFRDLSFVLVWVLILGGIYLLAADLSKEMRRGTLNFLRMSPLPGRQLLQGKLLGVPVLLYLGVGLMLPLHVASGLIGSFPWPLLLQFYALLGAIAFCFYATAMWFALLAAKLQGLQTWLISGLSAGTLFVAWSMPHNSNVSDWLHFFTPLHAIAHWSIERPGLKTIWPFQYNGFGEAQWFTLPVGANGAGYFSLALANAIVLGLWFWLMLERKYQMPLQTALSKRQSYPLTLCCSLIATGFSIQDINDKAPVSITFETFPIVMLMYGLALLFLLLPAKQALLDWARFRHQQPQQRPQQQDQQRPQRRRHRYSLMRDLLTHDSSPVIVAFAVNLGIVAGVMLLGIAIAGQIGNVTQLEESVGIWLCYCAVLTSCALVVQLLGLSNILHRGWLAAGAVTAMTLGWPMVLVIVGIEPYKAGALTALWLTTIAPHDVINNIYPLEILGAIAFHGAFITSLSLVLTRRVGRLGQSELKALMGTGRSDLLGS